MKSKIKKIDLLDLFSTIIASLVIFFVIVTLGTILWKGLPCFAESFVSEEVQFAIKLSIITASISTVICIILAIPTSYALTKIKIPFAKLWEIILEMPLSLPYLVLGLSLLLLFSSDFGKWLSGRGLTIIFSPNGIILAHVIVNLPFVIRIVKTAFLEIDPRLEFISRTLGASKWKSFLTITLPLAKNSILGAVVLAWSRALGEFGATLMLVGATRMKTETLPTSIYLNMATGDMGAAMASAIFLLFISACSLFVFRLFQSKGKNSRISTF